MRLPRLLVLLVCSAATAAAVDHPEEARKLAITAGGGGRLAWTAKLPPPVLPGTSPVAVGATLEIRAQNGETASFVLPESGWSLNAAGTTYTYNNALAPGGPSAVRKVTLKSQRLLKVSAKASGLTLDEASQGTVSLALTIGADVYCSACTTPVLDQPGRYRDMLCPAPAVCSSPTTTVTATSTTSSSSSTSSTLPSAVCGNGIRELPEQCDGADPGICPSIAYDFPWACEAPGEPTECKCCASETCMGPPFGGCCGDSTCRDVQGYGDARLGACIPPSCETAADCHLPGSIDCVGGSCCGRAWLYCSGGVPCCPGLTCTPFGSPSFCCIATGDACTTGNDCCTSSCTANVCD